MVSATLQIARVRICASDKPISAFTAVAKGAKLNQITKVRKNANQVKCKMRFRPVKVQIPATDSIPPKTQKCVAKLALHPVWQQPKVSPPGYSVRREQHDAITLLLNLFYCKRLNQRQILPIRSIQLSTMMESYEVPTNRTDFKTTGTAFTQSYWQFFLSFVY